MGRMRDGTAPRHPAVRRLTRSLAGTIPIVLAGSMAVSLTGPVQADDEGAPREKPRPSELGKTIREALAAAHAASSAEAMGAAPADVVAAAAPSSYTVQAGDTISSIAGRFGLATASVLALNGLGWKSVIFPGQSLRLTSATAAPIATPPAPVASSTTYTIVAGDTIGRIAARTGVSTQALLAANGLGPSSIIYAGRTLVVPAAGTTAPAPARPVAAPAPRAATSHVIASGDTIASIATQYGVSVQAVLAANGLGWSSIIYSGRTLTIPGVQVTPATVDGVTPLTGEMTANARTVISVGRSLGVSDYGIVIALAAAMQESSLRNLDHGDRDSLGLFQQRPSQGWGTPAQVMDPAHASRLFFGGPSNPNRGVTAGLLDVPGWRAASVTDAAQAVQRSAYPDAYAKWEVSAWSWLAELG